MYTAAYFILKYKTTFAPLDLLTTPDIYVNEQICWVQGASPAETINDSQMYVM